MKEKTIKKVVETHVIINDENVITKLNKKGIQDQLRLHGLKTTGNKNVLIKRIKDKL